MKKAIAYVRINPTAAMRGELAHGVNAQTVAIQEWADEAGVTITELVVECRSGRGPLRKLNGALESMERGEADTLVVADLYRLGRSVKTAARYMERAAEAGRLVAVRQAVDTGQPLGRFLALAVAGLAALAAE